MGLSSDKDVKIFELIIEIRDELARYEEKLMKLSSMISDGGDDAKECDFSVWLLELPYWKISILRLNPKIALFINSLSSSQQDKVFEYLETLTEMDVSLIKPDKIKIMLSLD